MAGIAGALCWEVQSSCVMAIYLHPEDAKLI